MPPAPERLQTTARPLPRRVVVFLLLFWAFATLASAFRPCVRTLRPQTLPSTKDSLGELEFV